MYIRGSTSALQANYKKMVVLLLGLIFVLDPVQSARILGLFPTPSVSHQSVFQPIWRELSLRGHKVTVITPNPLKDPSLTNLTEIDMSEAYEIQKKNDEKLTKTMTSWVDVIDIAFIHNLPQYEYMLEHEETKKIIDSPEDSFDFHLQPTVYSLSPLDVRQLFNYKSDTYTG